jgi:hypothetical protein
MMAITSCTLPKMESACPHLAYIMGLHAMQSPPPEHPYPYKTAPPRSLMPTDTLLCWHADGNVWEKAGVNVSVVYGSMPPEAYRAAVGNDEALKNMGNGGRVPFFAAGISSVMHPKNPHCPTMHFNYRCAVLRACAVQRATST